MFHFSPPEYLIKNDDDDFKGILTEKELDNLQEDVCDVIQYPTTIMDNKTNPKNGRCFRYDSGRTSFVYCASCSVFRICGGSKHCLDSDSIHAGLLFNFADDIINNKVDVVNTKICHYFKNKNKCYNNKSNKHIPRYIQKDTIIDGRSTSIRYLSYMCPIMGLTELIFPIIIENNIVAVLFAGQLLIKNKTKEIQEYRKNLLEAKKTMFDNYFKKYNITKSVQEEIINAINNTDDDNNSFIYDMPGDREVKEEAVGQKRQSFFNNEELEKYIYKKIFPQIISVQDKITEILNNRRNEYIFERINKNISKLQEEIDKLDFTEDCDKLISLFWAKTKNNMLSLTNIGIEKFIIFTYDENNFSENTFYAVCGSESDDYEDSYRQDINCFSLKGTDINSLKNNEPLSNVLENKMISEGYDPSKDELIYHQLLTQGCIAFFKYNQRISQNDALRKHLSNHLKNFLVNIMHEHAIVSNIAEVEKTKKTLSIYRHEISHLNLGLTGIYANFETPEDLYNISEEKALNIYQDFKSNIDIMNYMTAEIGLFTGSISQSQNIHIEEFKIYKELIWKWEILCRGLLNNESKNIKTIRDKEKWEKVLTQRPLVKSDKKLLEVIIYNIVNNAIKYSYFGSNIYIDCELIDHGRKQSFKVIDYGNSIPNNNLPYNLYFRDYKIRDSSTEGNGIGLFVSKKAAKLIGCEIRHTCEKISDYNVPFLKSWITFNNNANFPRVPDIHTTNNLKDIEAEFNRLCNSGEYYTIVNEKFQTKETVAQVVNEINEPTYKVVFEVII